MDGVGSAGCKVCDLQCVSLTQPRPSLAPTSPSLAQPRPSLAQPRPSLASLSSRSRLVSPHSRLVWPCLASLSSRGPRVGLVRKKRRGSLGSPCLAGPWLVRKKRRGSLGSPCLAGPLQTKGFSELSLGRKEGSLRFLGRRGPCEKTKGFSALGRKGGPAVPGAPCQKRRVKNESFFMIALCKCDASRSLARGFSKARAGWRASVVLPS